ncbi:hypothetical protein [Streptomyces sp. NPDC020983]
MFVGCLIALIAVVAGFVLAACSAYIPILREITGAAPLQDDDEDGTR